MELSLPLSLLERVTGSPRGALLLCAYEGIRTYLEVSTFIMGRDLFKAGSTDVLE